MVTWTDISDPSLRASPEPPLASRKGSIPDLDPPGTQVAEPLHVSDISTFEVDPAEFIRGAEELGLNTERKPIQPQQWRLANVLQAANANGITAFSTVGVCIPRRATKTTTIFAVLMGRCLLREDYQVAFTAQSGTKARERFLKDLVQPLERRYGADSLPWKINRGRGSERITFPNGSSLVVLPPIPDSFRGDAYDAVFADESQEHGPDLTVDLLGGILPTFDTRPGGQFIVAGTAGKHRSGLLWDTLEQGRAGDAGIVEYAAPDDTDPDDYADETLWWHVHPGLGTLTTIDAIRRNHRSLSPEAFQREYLGLWPAGGVSSFVDQVKFAAGAQTGDLPEPPASFGMAAVVHPDQSCAALVAAWRDEEGHACILVLDARPGTKWLAGKAAELARKYRIAVVHDTVGPVTVEIEQMQRMKPRPLLAPNVYNDVCTAAALFMKENALGNVRHWDQVELNEAVRLATKRGGERGRWAFGRANYDESIIALEGAALALRHIDRNPARKRIKAVVG